jgi:hypothetical protein
LIGLIISHTDISLSHSTYVCAGREGFFIARKNQNPDTVILFASRHNGLQIPEHIRIERIEFFGSVELGPRNTPITLEVDIFEIHGLRSFLLAFSFSNKSNNI